MNELFDPIRYNNDPTAVIWLERWALAIGAEADAAEHDKPSNALENAIAWELYP